MPELRTLANNAKELTFQILFGIVGMRVLLLWQIAERKKLPQALFEVGAVVIHIPFVPFDSSKLSPAVDQSPDFADLGRHHEASSHQ